MRSKRTDRKSLKAELERIKRENAELKAMAEAQKSADAPLQNVSDTPNARGAQDGTAVPQPPIILSGGYPAKAAVRTPKSLKEAKEILMSSNNW